jgi:hypothetical protein
VTRELTRYIFGVADAGSATPARRFGARDPHRHEMCAIPRQYVDGVAIALQVSMKKSTTKLALRTQTIRLLTNDALGRVPGGVEVPANGFIMQDTVIIQTGRR